MQYLRLNDGTELLDSYVALSGDRLFFYIQDGKTLAQVFALMNDPEKTSLVQYIGGNSTIEYHDYTVLVSISTGYDGLVTGVLTK